MDWDSNIGDNEGDVWIVLPDGTLVEFEVTEFEKIRTSNNNPAAKLTLSLFDGENFGRAIETLVLMEKCEWKICEFFIAIGQRKSGEVVKPDWDAVKGSKGKGRVILEHYKTKDGVKKECNHIATFLPPDTEIPAAGSQVPPEGDDDNLPF